MTSFAESRLASRLLRRSTLCLALDLGVVSAHSAPAQSFPMLAGFGSLPSFAWPSPAEIDVDRWSGSFARMSTGFAVSSSKHYGSYGGPTVGFEGGRMWQEGNLVYGIVGGFDYLAAMGGGRTGFGGLAYSRDFAGGMHVQVGALITPDLLVYTKLGAYAVHENLRWGVRNSPHSYSRDDVVVRPDARVGVEWAVTENISVAVEAGVGGHGYGYGGYGRGFR